MPYALFINNDKISKAYKTEQEVWKKADEAGLVVDLSSQEEKADPERVLDEDYCIKPCPADVETFRSRQESKKDIHQQAGRASDRAGKQRGRRVLAAKS